MTTKDEQPTQQEICGGCKGSGWVTRDPDIGTDQECFVCEGKGTVEPEHPAQQQEPVAIEYWLQDTMESGRWVTTDNMAKATAEKMLSGEYGDVYPQGRIVEPSPPASKPLTDERILHFVDTHVGGPSPSYPLDNSDWINFARAIEAAHGIKGGA